MTHDLQNETSNTSKVIFRQEDVLPRMRAILAGMPEVRVAYYQSGPAEDQIVLSGVDHTRVVVGFARSISKEMIGKRLARMQKRCCALFLEDTEFVNIEALSCREACEVAFNARVICGSSEKIERERLYRYQLFLEWNSHKKFAGNRQDTPPALIPQFERAYQRMSVEHFITPIHRHLKMIEGHLRELRQQAKMDLPVFSADPAHKSLAESYILKSVQSAVLITMSILHRRMRLAARDYRDLFLMLPVYGLMPRERASRLAKCADLRDRLMFAYDEVTAVEVYERLYEVIDTMHDFKMFMLEWLFEYCYGPTGELIQSE